jgi:hypothetical protein
LLAKIKTANQNAKDSEPNSHKTTKPIDAVKNTTDQYIVVPKGNPKKQSPLKRSMSMAPTKLQFNLKFKTSSQNLVEPNSGTIQNFTGSNKQVDPAKKARMIKRKVGGSSRHVNPISGIIPGKKSMK